MDKKELDALLEKVQSTINDSEVIAGLKTDLANLKDGSITPDSFKEQMEAMAEKNDIPGLKESIEAIGVSLKKLQDAGPKVEKSLRDRLIENHATLKEIAGGSKGKMLTLDGVKTTVARSAVSGSTLAHRLTDVGQQPYAAIRMADLFRQNTIPAGNNNGTIRYVDQATITRNAAGVAEAGTFPESVIDWIERNLPIEKIGDTIPVTQEAIDDVDFIEGEIRRLLEVNVALIEDNYLWDGTGTPPQMKGVYTSAGAFTVAANSKVDASIYDLIRSIKTGITNGKESKYMPNFVVMNPADVDIMQSKKDANFNYVMPPWVSNDGMNVAGLQIVESPVVTANTMLVGDFNYGNYWRSDAFTIELGWVASQFTADLMTLKARKRGALLVRTVDETAFKKITSISASLASMTV
jgi:HK97 family phage major capsid protein